MQTCPSCDGLNPVAARTCVHCDVALPRRSRLAARLALLLGPAGSILLAACYGGPGMYHRAMPQGPGGSYRLDEDHDGAYGPWQCGPNATVDCENAVRAAPPPADLDCDDHDPTRYPGAEDRDGDGIDQNCDGVDGFAPPGAMHVEPNRDYAQPPGSPPAKVAVPPGD
jgi:hypothetical protein